MEFVTTLSNRIMVRDGKTCLVTNLICKSECFDIPIGVYFKSIDVMYDFAPTPVLPHIIQTIINDENSNLGELGGLVVLGISSVINFGNDKVFTPKVLRTDDSKIMKLHELQSISWAKHIDNFADICDLDASHLVYFTSNLELVNKLFDGCDFHVQGEINGVYVMIKRINKIGEVR